MTARRITALATLLLLAATACSEPETPRRAARPERSAPAQPPAPTVGLDSVLLARATTRARDLPRLYSLLVWRQGQILSEIYFHERGPETPANIKSASKTIIATLVGIAIEEGHLEGVDQPIVPFFTDYLTGQQEAERSGITLENLLSMQAGLESTSGRNYGSWVSSPDWVRYAITRPLVEAPGGRMQYSTGSSHLLSAILTRATGMSTLAYAREKLGEPLGIDLRAWTAGPRGIYFGGNEMRMTPRQLLRFGELFLAGGVYDGRRVVSEEWIRQSWVPRTRSRYNAHRYGYGWWIKEARGHPVHFAWGYGGQYLFLVPDLEMIVVMTSVADASRSGDHLRQLHAILDDLLIPAAELGSAVDYSGDGSRWPDATAISASSAGGSIGRPIR